MVYKVYKERSGGCTLYTEGVHMDWMSKHLYTRLRKSYTLYTLYTCDFIFPKRQGARTARYKGRRCTSFCPTLRSLRISITPVLKIPLPPLKPRTTDVIFPHQG